MSDLKTKVAEALRGRILSLELAPGAFLDEARLAEEFRVSRTPLREVLQLLAGQGYVVLRAGQAPAVSAMDLGRMRAFFRTAPMIYCASARLAAEARGAGRLEELRAIQVSFRHAASGSDPARAALLNHRFHALIGQMAANPYLEAALGRLLIDHTRLSQIFFSPEDGEDAGRIRRAVADHDALIEAIGSGDEERAEQVMLDHWALSRDRIERFVTPAPLREPKEREALP